MGEVFAGRYELVDPIGRGGVGAVWRAWDHRRRRYVAAKVLLQSDAHSLLRFVREQALRIDHPHVLAPTSWAADDDKVLFTMDLVAGGSLVHLVGDYGPLPPGFVCTLLDQLLAGLAAVHAEDVVHRDIKPANVLLEATGTGRPRLRLSDFGIAMRMGEPRLTETNLVVGTPGYLAPEQMMGSEPDFPADLFAVGLVALYLLEGARPDAKALIQYFADHGTPGAPRGIPGPLWQVVASLLQPDPQARFRTATGARKALAAAAELLPEPGPDDELIEIFDQLGPLPPGFAAGGPLRTASGVQPGGGGGPAPQGTRPEAERGFPSDAGTAGRRAGPVPGPVPGPTGSAGPAGSAGPTGSARSAGSAWGNGAVSVPGRSSGTAGTAHAFAGAGEGGGVVPADPREGTVSSVTPSGSSPQPPGMSDTGSFPLPPPRAAAASSPLPVPSAPAHSPRTPERARHGVPRQPADAAPHVSPHGPTHPLRSTLPPSAVYPDASTAEYTARAPRVPPPGEAVPGRGSRRRSHRRRGRRPGPPAKVTVPLLLLALACYAVGFWALTRI
ncbi:protein kinase [Streptomyces sp. NPDC014986]|uniref:serine/threonine-protein kinase n=1 Tax=Streptomyces sp. NPDC014986 TaxID=3364934 RepID=UPI0037016933